MEVSEVPAKSKSVWVVYGRAEPLREDLFNFLRAIDLKPIEFDEVVALTKKGAPPISEVLQTAFDLVQNVIVLLTGDDEAALRDEYIKPDDPEYERVPTAQPRPNVLFEAGMAFGRYPDKTILVQIGSIRPISDITGRHVVRLDNTSKSRQKLVERLRAIGCDVNTTGVDWLEIGNFELADESLLGDELEQVEVEEQSEPETVEEALEQFITRLGDLGYSKDHILQAYDRVANEEEPDESESMSRFLYRAWHWFMERGVSREDIAQTYDRLREWNYF